MSRDMIANTNPSAASQTKWVCTNASKTPNLAKKPPLHPQNTMTISLMSQR